MGIDPTQTIVDLVTTTGELDPDKLGGYVVHHSSGVDVLRGSAAPGGRRARDRGSHRPAGRRGQVGLRHRRARHAAALRRDDAGRARPQRPPRAGRDDGHPHGQEQQARTADAQPPAVPARAHRARAQPAARPRRPARKRHLAHARHADRATVIPGDKEIGTAVNRGVPVTMSARARLPPRPSRSSQSSLLPQAVGSAAPAPTQRPRPQKRAASRPRRSAAHAACSRRASPGSPSRRPRRRRDD